MHFFHTILTTAHAEFSNDLKLVLGAIAKIYFITEPNSMPILRMKIFFNHNCSLIHTIFCNFYIHPPSLTSNTFIMVYCAHYSLHRTSQTLQVYFKPLGIRACLTTFCLQDPIHLPYIFCANQWLRVAMIFNFKIILYSARRIAITKKSLSLTTINVKYMKNIFLKIRNSHTITKLNGVANFCFSGYKVLTIIFKVIMRSSRCTIGSYVIYYIVCTE